MTDHIRLFTGKKIYANLGLMSVSENGKLFEGYDGYGPEPGDLTDSERRDLAEMMIARWRKWARIK